METKAQEFATKKHQGQFRRDGETPYIEHCRRVVELVPNGIGKTIAWLHDVLEDTDTTVEELRQEFGTAVAKGVQSLTRSKDETYFHFIERICAVSFLKTVKIADIVANLSDNPTPTQILKYYKALCMLAGARV